MCVPFRRIWTPGFLLIVLTGAVAVGGVLIPHSAVAQEQDQAQITHTVRQGDTLYNISRRYDVSIEQIRRLNDLEGNAISIGQVLRLTDREGSDPNAAAVDSTAAEAAADSTAAVDSTAAEAAADSTTAEAAADSSTAATDDREAAADSSAVADPAPPADSTVPGAIVASGGNIGRVIVASGTPLIDIAVRFAIHPDSLLALNPGLRDPLTMDTGVHVPVDRLVRLVTVRPGDTLFSIGREHGVSVERLREVNDLTSDNLAVGLELRIPVDHLEITEVRPAAPVFDIIASAVYPSSYSGRRLLDGRTYDPEDFVVSHPEIPIGTTVLVTVPETGKSAFAVVGDRGTGGAADLMDLSAAVAAELNMSRSGTRLLEVRIVD